VITKLNLASDPFRNRALPWTITAIVTLFSITALVFIAKWTFDTNAKVQAASRDVAELRKQTDAINQRADAIKTALTPEQERSLKSAHTVVNRKQFSWSQLFADLENSLPGNVRVTRIAVKEVRAQNDRTVANLELIVVSKSPPTVTQMIEDMEHQGVFHAELVSVNLQRGKESGGAEYEMNVRYAPRAGVSIESGDKNNRPVDTASEGVKPQ
jgi:Tfp pilus assembly protein PilN